MSCTQTCLTKPTHLLYKMKKERFFRIGNDQRLGRLEFVGEICDIFNIYVVTTMNSVVDDPLKQYRKEGQVFSFRFLKLLSHDPNARAVSQVLPRCVPVMLARFGKPSIMSLIVSQTRGIVQICSINRIENEQLGKWVLSGLRIPDSAAIDAGVQSHVRSTYSRSDTAESCSPRPCAAAPYLC
jgi:hypothetical protein